MAKKKAEKKVTVEKKKRKNSRSKGAGFERETAKLLTDWWGVDFHRVPASGGLHWKDDNRVSGDIVAPPDSDFPFSVECKKVEGWNFEQIIKGTGLVTDWWSQCTRDADEFNKAPLLIFSKNRSPVFFMVRVEDFKKFEIKTNYFITTVELDEKMECVGIGYFEKLTAIEKEKIINLFS